MPRKLKTDIATVKNKIAKKTYNLEQLNGDPETVRRYYTTLLKALEVELKTAELKLKIDNIEQIENEIRQIKEKINV